MIANTCISSQFCSVECGDIFITSQATRGMEALGCRDAYRYFFLSGEIGEVTNLIDSALYRDKTDLIHILAFSNTACYIQLPS